MRFKVFCLLMLGMALVGLGGESDSRRILDRFVRDFREDPAAREEALVFGVRILDEGDWRVVVDGRGGVELVPGFPQEPMMYYQLDGETLKMIDRGKMSALTAMGRARMSDPAPMDLGFTEGFSPEEGFMGWVAEFTFHFWTRGFPETITFGEETSSRKVHGAQAKVLYYQRGFRSSWYRIRPGQHINADPGDQVNPFDTLIIMIRGTAAARIGGKQLTLEEDRSYLIPAGVAHEFWNDGDEVADFIIIMFGAGA